MSPFTYITWCVRANPSTSILAITHNAGSTALRYLSFSLLLNSMVALKYGMETVVIMMNICSTSISLPSCCSALMLVHTPTFCFNAESLICTAPRCTRPKWRDDEMDNYNRHSPVRGQGWPCHECCLADRDLRGMLISELLTWTEVFLTA